MQSSCLLLDIHVMNHIQANLYTDGTIWFLKNICVQLLPNIKTQKKSDIGDFVTTCCI